MKNNITNILSTFALTVMAFSHINAMDMDTTMAAACEVCVEIPQHSPVKVATGSCRHEFGVSARTKQTSRFFKILPPEIAMKQSREKRKKHTEELRNQRRAHKINTLRFSRIKAGDCSYHGRPYTFVDPSWRNLSRLSGLIFLVNTIPYFIPTCLASYLQDNYATFDNIDPTKWNLPVHIIFPSLEPAERDLLFSIPTFAEFVIKMLLADSASETEKDDETDHDDASISLCQQLLQQIFEISDTDDIMSRLIIIQVNQNSNV